MIAYHTPGVYFERRDISPLVIGLPRTDIAGFAGIAMRGPLLEPVKIESWVQFVSTFGDYIPQGYLAYSVFGFFANGGRTCWVSRVADQQTARRAVRELGDVGKLGPIRISAGTEGSWGNRIHVRPFFNGAVLVALSIRFPDGQEQFVRAPFLPPEGQPDNLFRLPQTELDVKQFEPALVRFEKSPIIGVTASEGFLKGGADGLANVLPAHFEKAFDALGEINEIGIVAAPDLMPKQRLIPRFQVRMNCCTDPASIVPSTPPALAEFPPQFDDDQVQDLQMALTTNAERLRYRFAILDDGGELTVPPDAISLRHKLRESSFASLYYPWICVDDPLRIDGLVRAIPPSGHVAGIFARSDQRKGVHKPPMNEVLEAVSDVRFPVGDEDHGELNDNNVNAIRALPGRGVRVMGARTLCSQGLLLRYVNVRRLLSVIEKALEQSLYWTVFEPNNPHLWSEIDRSVRSLLEDLFRGGMLDGGTSEEAYSVRCNDDTNPRSETEQGRVTCEVGIKPPYPAEFVVVTLGITKDGIQIREAREQSA